MLHNAPSSIENCNTFKHTKCCICTLSSYFTNNQQRDFSGVVDDRKLRNTIELLESVSAKPSSSIMDRAIVAISCLDIVSLETTLREEIICLWHGFLEHESFGLLETVTEWSKVSSNSLYWWYSFGQAEGCFREGLVFFKYKLHHWWGRQVWDLGCHHDSYWSLGFLSRKLLKCEVPITRPVEARFYEPD